MSAMVVSERVAASRAPQVRKTTRCPVRFWFFDRFMSPDFKSSMAHFASSLNVTFECPHGTMARDIAPHSTASNRLALQPQIQTPPTPERRAIDKNACLRNVAGRRSGDGLVNNFGRHRVC